MVLGDGAPFQVEGDSSFVGLVTGVLTPRTAPQPWGACRSPFLPSTTRYFIPYRALASNQTTAAITPGPGAYSGPGSGIGTSGTVAGFVSGVPRLPADYELRARKEVPG